MNQEQLIRSIEQRLEDLMFYDSDLSYDYECELYCNDEPITELFTPQLLKQLEHIIDYYGNETKDLSYTVECY